MFVCFCVKEGGREGGGKRERETERYFNIAPTGLIFTKLVMDVMPILMESILFCRDILILAYTLQ